MDRKESEMRGPYGFEPSDNCQTCGLRAASFFCQLPPAALKDFNAVRSTATYPEGAVLFLEKQDPRGVFVLCAGQVKLSISSSAGKTLILRITKPGEILGLMAVMSGTPYEVTAETLHPCQVAYVTWMQGLGSDLVRSTGHGCHQPKNFAGLCNSQNKRLSCAGTDGQFHVSCTEHED